ncbi:NAD binding domain of 6-phosphogluconate dehydrogenase family protein [Lyngbya aestuarii BL J]|mgnify:CR=1 FL=1|uniref:NAD binding domain of 6-phosphogluconate dehydrogenase family protein n=1 Tax=Lyngbya aestuarii BL J TaxID=1348334 RepID=U7QF64_9CYAN|nr:NAD(P)-dependent oxidoreductase [Lyngbya aestuarii]ERT05882.1 NAD binding domain of 6-phosphogluconate dehydrogenase family protein [Lyngbya aestuarii BL J]
MKVGLIGTGLMGQPMALRLVEANLEVMAYNRTASKLDPLKADGVQVADSPQSLIAASECIILMLADAPAIETVLLSPESRQELSGKTVIQMGTIAPQESRTIAERVTEAGGEYLEAPVLGSIPQVKSGTLQVMVGATEAQFQQWSDLLKNLGEPVLIGSVGTAAATKLGLNQLIAALTSAFGLSLSFVQHQGADVEKFMQILRESALYAPTFDKKLQRMQDGNYANPNFPTKHLLKDTNLFLKAAAELGLNTSSLEGVKSLLEAALTLGVADDDYSALFEGIKPQKK